MERKITEALPKMIEKSTDPDLTSAFQTHLQETRGHVSKIESLLRKATGEASTETCKVINVLTTEASDTIKDVTDPTILNVALIGAAQQVEHHEIALYGTLRTWANILAKPRMPRYSSPSSKKKKTRTKFSLVYPIASMYKQLLRTLAE